MINKKIIAVGSVLSIGSALAVVACGTTTGTTQQSKFVEVAFKTNVPIADTLSAATGAMFSATTTSYENAGNENTTTRAGLRVRKSSVISALKNNLGIDSENKVTNLTTLTTAVNKLLNTTDALVPGDFTNLDTVEITLGKTSGAATLFDDLVPSSKKSPVIDLKLTITFHAKEGMTIGKQKTPRLTLKGDQKIRLTDYRRVDQSTLEAVTNKPVITVAAAKPTSVTMAELIKALDKHFDITDSKFATPFFPIWNEAADGTPLYTLTNGAPVKHSLNNEQITDLQKLYKGKTVANNNMFGDFPRPRIGRAVEKVHFTLPTGSNGTTVVTATSEEYEVLLNLNIDFIKHWSWNKTPHVAHSEWVKTWTVPVTLKVKFTTAPSTGGTGAMSGGTSTS